jgi:pyrimidine-nucleoside phosphorylase
MVHPPQLGIEMTFLPAELIKKKRNRQAHTNAEITFLVQEYVRGGVADYQMSAWLMAAFLNGLTVDETKALTQAMLNSGEQVSFDHGFCVDKHSTGGVGDKTSLILGPIVAAAGVSVPMISGRGLGHTGGTLDKLESIPGFNTQLDLVTFRSYVQKYGICFIGQTKEICPADKRMYALRDVTATVESLPLICASIMSKKLAEGIHGLVLDVKVGSGAFMKTQEEALTLAQSLIRIGQAAGKKVSALITSMEQPLGQMIGNALEVEECLAILRNEPEGKTLYADTRELSLELAAEMIRLGQPQLDVSTARARAEHVLTSGAAEAKFTEICVAQGARLEALPKATQQHIVTSPVQGYVHAFDTEKIGIAGILLGAGRAQTSDKIDPVAGIRCHKKIGEEISKDEPLFTLYGSQSKPFLDAQKTLLNATRISLQKQPSPSLIFTRLLDQR